MLVVAVIAVVVVALVNTRGGDTTATETSPKTSETDNNPNFGPAGDAPRRADGDPMVLGSATAPVTMVEFADFRCPFCAQFTRDTEPELIKRYVDTGVLRIEWRDSPIFGDQSFHAARAGRAAAEQNRFWQFTRAVLDAAPQTGHANLDDTTLVAFAKDAGVPDLSTFRRALDSDRFDNSIRADSALAQRLFIPTTPAFWINGTPILGSQPLQVFIDVIEGSRRR